MNLELMLDLPLSRNTLPAQPLQTARTPYHDKIENLDLEPIKYKLIKEKGWPLQKADTVEKLYKAYLLLFALYPSEEHVPTHDIDEMWHSHILDTQKYMSDCDHIFGYYLHHYPYLGLMGAEDAALATAQFERTRQRFVEVSGLDPAEAAGCGGGGCGGGGCSGGSSCSSGGSSCSSGGDSGTGHDSGGSHDSGITPIPIPISSCTSGTPTAPLKDKFDKKKDKAKDKPKTPTNDNPLTEKKKEKKPFWKRVFHMMKRQPEPETAVREPTRWERSVDPRRMRNKGRPTRLQLLAMLEAMDTEGVTKH